MKKLIAVATIAVAGLTVGGTAFAGETTGGPRPKPTPISDFGHAQSICAFSGLNDVPGGDILRDPITDLPVLDPITGQPVIDPLSVGKVQNWGHTQRIAKSLLTPAEFAAAKAENKPGVTCNGRTGIVAVVTGG